MNLKPLAILATALSFAVTPSAFAWYASTPNIVITDTITQLSATQWRYAYNVDNQSTCFGNCADTVMGRPIESYVLGVKTYSIPFFSDAGIINIDAPSGWAYQILSEDTFNLNYGAGTLQWYATDDNAFIALSQSLSGFSYTTAFAPGKGPFASTFGNNDSYIGDPAIPLSPNAILAGIGQSSAVPEPTSALLMLAGFGALVARRRFAPKSL